MDEAEEQAVEARVPHTGTATQPLPAPQWMDEAIEVLVSESPNREVKTVRLLSHALPCPPTPQESQRPIDESGVALCPATAFPYIVDAINLKLRPVHHPIPCILVTHAVPPHFNLSNLPSTPPITPNLTGSSPDDYFATQVFNTAVSVPFPVIEHQVHEPPEAPVLRNTPSMPSTPIPLVPPNSIHVSLLERYIPPSSTQEYLNMFSRTGGSTLADRLVELKEHGASLLFIHPTQAGAHTFATECLGPILDPMLRAMSVIHDLSADVGTSIGHMESVSHMFDFETMTDKINGLCRTMSSADEGSLLMQQPPKFEVVHASRGNARLDRRVWSYWWTQQETPRIRDVIQRYFRRARSQPRAKDVPASQLIRELVDGVAQRPYSPGRHPGAVEVGVWVIRRTQ